MTDNNIDELPEEHDETFEYHGRLYHRLSRDSRASFVPVDEQESQRLVTMHSIITMKMGGLIIPEASALRRVLDCGTGNGCWAIDVAQNYPNCEVHAVDVSTLMMPFGSPPNLFQYQCDLNEPIPYDDGYFDLVQSRMVSGGINANRWNRYVREIKRILVRRGWVQMMEVYLNAQCPSGDYPGDGALRQWSSKYLAAMSQLGKDPRAGMRLGTMLRAAGFGSVEETSFELPMCDWPTDPQERQLGAWNQSNVSELLESHALWPLTSRRGLRMPIDEFNELLTNARADASNLTFKVVSGEKP
ncbi:UMTA methyltransferase [Seiridium cupressi]